MLSFGVCVCVCVSVTFVSCVKTHKDIFEIFSPSDMHAHHSSFSVPNVMAIFRRETPLTGASNAGRVGRNRDSEPMPTVDAATGEVL